MDNFIEVKNTIINIESIGVVVTRNVSAGELFVYATNGDEIAVYNGKDKESFMRQFNEKRQQKAERFKAESDFMENVVSLINAYVNYKK